MMVVFGSILPPDYPLDYKQSSNEEALWSASLRSVLMAKKTEKELYLVKIAKK